MKYFIIFSCILGSSDKLFILFYGVLIAFLWMSVIRYIRKLFKSDTSICCEHTFSEKDHSAFFFFPNKCFFIFLFKGIWIIFLAIPVQKEHIKCYFENSLDLWQVQREKAPNIKGKIYQHLFLISWFKWTYYVPLQPSFEHPE